MRGLPEHEQRLFEAAEALGASVGVRGMGGEALAFVRQGEHNDIEKLARAFCRVVCENIKEDLMSEHKCASDAVMWLQSLATEAMEKQIEVWLEALMPTGHAWRATETGGAWIGYFGLSEGVGEIRNTWTTGNSSSRLAALVRLLDVVISGSVRPLTTVARYGTFEAAHLRENLGRAADANKANCESIVQMSEDMKRLRGVPERQLKVIVALENALREFARNYGGEDYADAVVEAARRGEKVEQEGAKPKSEAPQQHGLKDCKTCASAETCNYLQMADGCNCYTQIPCAVAEPPLQRGVLMKDEDCPSCGQTHDLIEVYRDEKGAFYMCGTTRVVVDEIPEKTARLAPGRCSGRATGRRNRKWLWTRFSEILF